METINLKGKAVIVTGASSGIGKYTACYLADKGARVILACRSEDRGNKTSSEIQELTGNKDVVFRKLDLGSFESVRKFCNTIQQEEDRLDILINNAGALHKERHLSEDGNELVLSVNFLGPFLLIRLLLNKLKNTASSRIINVTSAMYEKFPLDLKDLQSETNYRYDKAYGRGKTALVMMTVYLAEKLKQSGVSIYSLHPGVIQDTGIYRDLSFLTNKCARTMFGCFMPCLTCEPVLTVEEGSRTTLHCALAPGLEKQSGKHFSRCRERQMKQFVCNKRDNEKLWNKACALCGVSVDID